MRTIVFLLVVFVLFSVTATGDVKPPSPTPKPVDEMTGRMYIDLKSDAKVATLKIRREALHQLRAAIDEADDAHATAAVSSTRLSRTQTIVSGTLFSLAFAFGGVWLFRHRGTKIAMSVVVSAALGTGALFVFANTPPPTFISLTTNIFDKQTKQYGYAAGGVKIQVLDRVPGVYNSHDRDDVILEIPRGEVNAGGETE